MTVRELINKLMDLNLDKPVYITEYATIDSGRVIGLANHTPILKSNYQIVDVGVHGIYNDFYNCITIDKKKE